MSRLKQVAERAGVSTATVSRVFSGANSVSGDLRGRVLTAAAEYNYRPNRLASNLRRQKTATIGVLVSDIENPHYTRIVRIIEAIASETGYRVILCNTDETAAKQRDYLNVLADERVEGVIMVPTDPASDEIGHLLDMGIPVVALDRTVADPRADAVIIDNAGGTRRATDYLIEHGHRRIGFIGGRPEIQTGAERLAGYEAAMMAHGLEPCSAPGGFRIDGARAATTDLLTAEPDITALVVANNLMAIGALHAMRDLHRRVPDDIALIAIDDPFWADLVDPPLTTLAQPIQRIAERAAGLLFARIAGETGRSKCLVFSFELRVRGSCGTALARSGGQPVASGVRPVTV